MISGDEVDELVGLLHFRPSVNQSDPVLGRKTDLWKPRDQRELVSRGKREPLIELDQDAVAPAFAAFRQDCGADFVRRTIDLPSFDLDAQELVIRIDGVLQSRPPVSCVARL